MPTEPKNINFAKLTSFPYSLCCPSYEASVLWKFSSKNGGILVFIGVFLLGMLQQIWDTEILVAPSSWSFKFILTSCLDHLELENLNLKECVALWTVHKANKHTCKQTPFPNLHSASVRTRCSLCGRDTQSFQGSWYRCGHMSVQRNTHLYLN